MNAEILARLEDYPKLVLLQPQVSYLEMENQQLKDALEEQKRLVAQLQELISMSAEEARQGQSTEEIITEKFNELKAQSDYLETLKAELLAASKERDEVKNTAEALVEEQAAAIERLRKSQEANALILKGFRKVFLKAADGDDDELKKLVQAFQVLSEKDE